MKSGKKNTIIRFVQIVLIAFIVFSSYKIIDIKLTERRENKNFEDLRHKIKIAKDKNTTTGGRVSNKDKSKANDRLGQILKSENKDCVGWLTIPNTPIDYPVMTTPSAPDYYLRRNFQKKYSISGTPYIGEGLSPDKRIFTIYAHHMKNSSLFGTLENYKNKNYKNEHKFVYFNTMGENRKYQVVGAFYVDLDKPHFRYYEYNGDITMESFIDFLAGLSNVSMYDEVKDINYSDQIIMLSTCSYFVEEGRFVVVAKKL